jgi:hypothetical protein
MGGSNRFNWFLLPCTFRANLFCGILVSIVIAFLIIAPVSAGEKYMAGSPELTAAISGTNEFSPGDDVIITVRLQNKGLNEYKFVKSGIINRDDLPNTAKLLMVDLGQKNGYNSLILLFEVYVNGKKI